MSCYDTVFIFCPCCNTQNSIQTKAGDCELKNYSQQAVPPAIAADLDKTVFNCDHCGEEFIVRSLGNSNIPLMAEKYEGD